MVEIATLDQLEDCLRSSQTTAVLLLKHSTRCPISADAYARVEKLYATADPALPPLYLIKVIESRPVSDEIARRLGVVHKSPQVLLVKGGRAGWEASHHGIQADRIREAVAAHAG